MSPLFSIMLIGVPAAVIFFVNNHHKTVQSSWTEAANELGFTLKLGGIFSKPEMQGTIDGIRVAVDVYSSRGENKSTYTRFRAFHQPVGPPVTLKRQGAMSFMRRFIGGRDVEIGDPYFDQKVIIDAQGADQVAEFLTPARRAAVLDTFEAFSRAEITHSSVTVEHNHLDTDPGSLIRTTYRVVDVARIMGDSSAVDAALEKRSAGRLADSAADLHDINQGIANSFSRMLEAEALVELGDHEGALEVMDTAAERRGSDAILDGWKAVAQKPPPPPPPPFDRTLLPPPPAGGAPLRQPPPPSSPLRQPPPPSSPLRQPPPPSSPLRQPPPPSAPLRQPPPPSSPLRQPPPPSAPLRQPPPPSSPLRQPPPPSSPPPPFDHIPPPPPTGAADEQLPALPPPAQAKAPAGGSGPDIEAEPEPVPSAMPAAESVESESATPTAEPVAAAPERSGVPQQEVIDDLFETGRFSFEMVDHFEQTYAGQLVSWAGEVQAVSGYRHDSDFGEGPASKVTVVLGSSGSSQLLSSQVQGVLQMAAGVDLVRGSQIEFQGTLVRLDRFARRIYVANAH